MRDRMLRPWKRAVVASSVAVMLAVTAACGDGSLGDSCETEGKVDGECDDGLVCGKHDGSASLTCLKQCQKSEECASGEECSGLSGSLKGCRKR